MTRDDIIRMAREAGCMGIDDYYTNGPVRAFSDVQLERFAALVAAAEREACAKVADSMDPLQDGAIAAAIRARSEG